MSQESTRHMTKKIKSRIESIIAIAYLLTVVLILKGTTWLYGDEINMRFGENSGGFAAYVFIPLTLIVAGILVPAIAYFIISFLFGKESANEIIFRRQNKTFDNDYKN